MNRIKHFICSIFMHNWKQWKRDWYTIHWECLRCWDKMWTDMRCDNADCVFYEKDGKILYKNDYGI